jgi:hypothetical protein
MRRRKLVVTVISAILITLGEKFEPIAKIVEILNSCI